MMKPREHITARQWLKENGYDDVADIIDAIMVEWRLTGKKTRRNWWEILAGGMGGKPRRVGQYTFPILAVAQKHQGMPITPNAIQRSADEKIPPLVYLGRSKKSRSN